MPDVVQKLIVCDLDETLVRTMEQLQIYVWKTWKAWFPLKCVDRHHGSAPSIYNYILEQCGRPAGFPDTLESFSTELFTHAWSKPHIYTAAIPYFDIWQALLGWKGSIYFLSARLGHLHRVTQGWLEHWGLGRWPLKLTADKVGALDVIEAEYDGWDIHFIDDNATTILEVEKHFSGRIRCYMVKAPWNKWVQKMKSLSFGRRICRTQRLPHAAIANLITNM